jgi:hypothetical protein
MEATPMITVRGRQGKDADHRFAEPPWDEQTPRWQEIDQGLPADHEACTPSAKLGRSVSRLEHEDLVDKLRARMETTEAKELYKLRRQTIELRYADLKEHRQLRRFHHYGEQRARAQIGSAVLAYNLLVLWKNLKTLPSPAERMYIPEEVPS